MERFLEQLKNLRHRIVFDAEKKAATRLQLAAYIRGRAAVHSHQPTITLINMRFLKFAVPVMVIVLLGAGTSFAAEGALPGQPLYAVKTGFNEKVAAALAVTPQAKADLNAKLAATRLAEANQLAAEGKLDDATAAELSDSFQSSADKAQTSIAALRASGDAEAAASISSDFESSLQAHERALAAILASRGGENAGVHAGASIAMSAAAPMAAKVAMTSDTEANIDGQNADDNGSDSANARAIVKIALPLRATLKMIENDNANADATLTTGAEAQVKAAVDAKLAASANTIADARAALAEKSSQISSSAAAKAKAELDAADQLMIEARAKADAKAYADAIVLSGKAARMANEVSVLLSLQVKLNGAANSRRQEPAQNDELQGANSDSAQVNVFSGDDTEDSAGSGAASSSGGVQVHSGTSINTGSGPSGIMTVDGHEIGI